MNTPVTPNTPDTSEEHAADSGIVSVNDGPRARSPVVMYAIVALAGIAMVVGAATLIGKFKLSQATGGNNQPQIATGTPIDPGGTLAKFDDAPPPTISIAGVTSPSAPTAPTPECADILAKDPEGKLIIGTDGMPVMLTCDGRAKPGSALPPTVSIAGATGLPVIRDRYGGGILIEPPATTATTANMLPTPPAEAMELLRQASTGQLGAFPRSAPLPSLDERGIAGQTAAAGPATAKATTPRHKASYINGDRWLVLRGSQIECYLTLAYASDFAGEAHCLVARDVFGRDGTQVVIDRGSVVNGTFRAVSTLGDRRAFVMWDRLVTPTGVTVVLNSDGTDALGATGLPAKVDNRWWDRIGIALAVSSVKDLTTAFAARQGASAATTSTTGEGLADQILAQTNAIKPSLYVRQGAAASIVLRGDLDFSDVYGSKR